MFHAISGWLTRHARQIRDYRLNADQAYAIAHGWQSDEVAPGAWIYRDPRFDQLMATQPASQPAPEHQRVSG
jgi:hypothetical protein